MSPGLLLPSTLRAALALVWQRENPPLLCSVLYSALAGQIPKTEDKKRSESALAERSDAVPRGVAAQIVPSPTHRGGGMSDSEERKAAYLK